MTFIKTRVDAQENRTPDVLVDASPGVVEIYAYWYRSRGSRHMPRREDFDPIDLPHLLPGLLLIDVEGLKPDGTGLYRYRVVGSYEVESRRHDPTGKRVEEGFYAESVDQALSDYESVRIRKEPFYAPLDFVDDRGRRVQEHSILLPYSEDGDTVSQILVYSERVKLRR